MKRIGIADFKARLSEHLRVVRRGGTLTIFDRDTPVAQVVPVTKTSGLRVRRAAGKRGGLRAVRLPPPLKLNVDAVELLLQDRRGEL